MLIMKSKNKVAWLMVMLLVLQVVAPVGVVSFAGANDIVLNTSHVDDSDKNGYEVSESDIDVDDDFNLTIYAISTANTDTTIFAEVSGSNFEPEDGSSKKSASITATSGSTTEFNFSLIRTGNSNSLTVTFTDQSGATIGSETIYIEEADKIDTSSDDDDDDDSSEDPDVILDMDAAVQEFVAGKDATLYIRLDALEKMASDVKVTFTDDADDLPFIFEDSKPYFYVDRVSKTGKVIEKDITISPLAKSKVYGLGIKIEYENSDDVSFTEETTLYVKITNDEVEPILGVSEYKFSGEKLRPDGGKQAVAIRIKNSGTLEARDVRAQLKGFTVDGLHIDGDVDTKAISKINGGQEELVYFTIKPSDNASTGQHPLELVMTYNDEAGNEYSKTANIYVPVEGKDSEAIEMEVSELVYPDRINAGDTFELSFKLTNLSEVDAKSVELELEYPSGFVPKASPKKYVKDLEGGASYEHKYLMMAKEDVETNHYDMYINVNYKAEGDDEEGSIKEYVGVGVDGSSGLGRPKILIDDYSFEGETVMAGEEFELNLRFFNTSSDDIVKNIKVSVSSDDGVFSPVDSSSSFFIERIGRQDYADYVLKLETKRDASVKTYNLNLVMEYEDGEGNAYDSQEQPYKEEESLGIPVSQPVRLETGDIMTPFEAYIGNPADIEVEFYNMGRSAMYNMFVKLEGDFRSQDSSYFVGNFDSGNSEYFMASVIPEEEGEIVGKIVFTFEDALGNPSTVEKEFSFFAMGAPDYGNEFEGEFPIDGEYPGDMGMDGEEGGSKIWLYVGGALVAVAALVVFVRYRKKKKLEMLQALEDDDE